MILTKTYMYNDLAILWYQWASQKSYIWNRKILVLFTLYNSLFVYFPFFLFIYEISFFYGCAACQHSLLYYNATFQQKATSINMAFITIIPKQCIALLKHKNNILLQTLLKMFLSLMETIKYKFGISIFTRVFFTDFWWLLKVLWQGL